MNAGNECRHRKQVDHQVEAIAVIARVAVPLPFQKTAFARIHRHALVDAQYVRAFGGTGSTSFVIVCMCTGR